MSLKASRHHSRLAQAVLGTSATAHEAALDGTKQFAISNLPGGGGRGFGRGGGPGGGPAGFGMLPIDTRPLALPPSRASVSWQH
jgi:hypothetical protein